VVEVNLGAQGFYVAGRTVKPLAIADMINACGVLSRRDLIIVSHGPKPTGVAAHTLFGALAEALGRDVIAADADVSLSLTGRLFTSGEFRRWRGSPIGRAGNPGHGPVPLGDVLPPVTLPPAATGAGSSTTPAHDVSDQRHVEDDRVDRKAPATNQDLSRRPAPNRLPTNPLWISPAACDESDRLRLREVLDDNYDAHARAVIKALAAGNGTADTRPAPSTVTGLIAVRAYCSDERDAVNQMLRGATDVQRPRAASVIGRCAAMGLRRLPAVVGPVFAVGSSRAQLAAYRIGLDIAEPAFIDV
jgi:hypothetical protein